MNRLGWYLLVPDGMLCASGPDGDRTRDFRLDKPTL
jgi:hypothetical protein